MSTPEHPTPEPPATQHPTAPHPTAQRREQAIVVQTTTDVPASSLFALLSDPRRHPEMDGSGMVRASPDAQPITSVGQVFTMAMHQEQLGDYRTENHVLDLEPDHLLAWTTANVGQPPAGVRWSWELGRDDAGRTTVTHTYDWSGVTDAAVLARVTFPRVPAEALVESVSRLVAAAG